MISTINTLAMMAATPPRSLVPLTEKLPTDDGVHPAARHPRRRRLEALTRENTEPIRLVLDDASPDAVRDQTLELQIEVMEASGERAAMDRRTVLIVDREGG